jgi:Tat protein secretion system quality control protein TatD with DNase activity
VFHCFTETAEVARAALDLGFYISFSGILTFKTAPTCGRWPRSCRWIAA